MSKTRAVTLDVVAEPVASQSIGADEAGFVPDTVEVTLDDVEVVRTMKPEFAELLLIAAVARTRANNIRKMQGS